MTIGGAKALGQRAVGWVVHLPLLALLGAGVGLLALALLAFVGMSGPPYQALFQGLEPAQGGAVITELQKLGVPYRLQSAGTVIAVPASDVGLARLQLAAAGLPGGGAATAWKALESAPMTASQPSVNALRLQAIQRSLEQAVRQVSGATAVRVMVWLPRGTPFLATQPRAKASVVVAGAPQPDEALGMAIAKLVAGAVPGLAAQNVVIVTGHGRIIYPASRTFSATRALAVQSQIESAQEAKIRSLLAPLFGADNFRVVVSANVRFARKTIQAVTYGPHSYAVTKNIEQSRRVGHRNLPIGIPGALSNQPPGPTTAPVTAAAATPANTNTATAAGRSGSAKPPPPPPQPISTSKKGNTSYAIDTTRLVSHPAAWRVRDMTVSVVINKAAMAATTLSDIRKLVAATTALPTNTIDVMAVDFITAASPGLAARPPILPTLVRAGLLLAAALAFLFGFLVPASRWLPWMAAVTVLREAALPSSPVEDEEAVVTRRLFDQAVEKVRHTAQVEPAVVARTLQKWLD